MKRLAQAVAITTLTAAPLAAYETRNDLTVTPLSSETFEVIEGGEFGARSIWCAAADFADRQLNAAGSDRIYVARPRGDSETVAGRKGVVFTLTEPSSQPGGLTVLSQTIRIAGSSLPLHHAKGFCRDDRLLRSN